MKKNATLVLAFFLVLSFKAQIATFTLSEYIPESASVTNTKVFNPNFENAFIFLKASGATVFNQNKEVLLVDANTFAEKKKIDLPKYKVYDVLEVPVQRDVNVKRTASDLNKNIIFFYSSKIKKDLTVSAVKVNESLVVSENPQYLFTTTNDFSIKFFKNEKKDMCIFSFFVDDAKQKKDYFHCKLFDSELKLLASDSTRRDPGTWCSAFVYDNGYAIAKTKSTECNIAITDFKVGKDYNFNLSNGLNTILVNEIKQIAGDKIVLAGRYLNVEDKKMKNGFFKVVFNTVTGTVEQQVYFEHVPAGEDEREDKPKNIHKLIITDTGACYFLISQGVTPPHGNYDVINKYELVYLNTISDKWKKQLPMPYDRLTDMLFTNNNLYIVHMDYEGDNTKIDPDNYVYGKPKPGQPITQRQDYKTNSNILKVSTLGKIQRQNIADIYYHDICIYKNSFIGLSQGLNGPLFSKCKFFKLTDLK